MLKIEALGFCNFYVHIGANSGDIGAVSAEPNLFELCRVVTISCDSESAKCKE